MSARYFEDLLRRHAVQALGSAECGPGVLPQHRLEVGTADFALLLTPIR